MRFPENRVGLTTVGLTGNIIIAGVIFTELSAWWLILGVVLVMSATGIEVGQKKSQYAIHRKNRCQTD